MGHAIQLFNSCPPLNTACCIFSFSYKFVTVHFNMNTYYELRERKAWSSAERSTPQKWTTNRRREWTTNRRLTCASLADDQRRVAVVGWASQSILCALYIFNFLPHKIRLRCAYHAGPNVNHYPNYSFYMPFCYISFLSTFRWWTAPLFLRQGEI